MADLDQLLRDAASDTRRWSADSPVPIETLEGHARRRRTTRLASVGATALAVVAIAAAVSTTGNSDHERSAVSVAAEPPPAVRTATPDDVQNVPSPTGEVRIEGLPTEGVAVEDGGVVQLLSIDGAVLQRLDGFHIQDSSRVGALVLAGPDGTEYELDALAGVLAPRPGSAPVTQLSYGGTLGSSAVVLDGETVFTIDDTEYAHVSWDRDIVTRMPSDPATAPVAFDLRTAKPRRLPERCQVVDRHGPAWFLLCGTADRATSIVRLDPDGSISTLAGPRSESGAGWDDAMVSPDGQRLLAYSCSYPSVSFGATSGDGGLHEAELDVASLDARPLGWSAHGEAILVAGDGCDITATMSDGHGVFAYEGTELRTITASAGKAAMWMPLLQKT